MIMMMIGDGPLPMANDNQWQLIVTQGDHENSRNQVMMVDDSRWWMIIKDCYSTPMNRSPLDDHHQWSLYDYGKFFGINICDSYAIHDGYDD